MIESWMIQLRLDKEEKEKLMQAYKEESISVSGRVLKLIREDVAMLKGEK